MSTRLLIAFAGLVLISTLCTAAPRHETLLDSGWTFAQGEFPGAERADYGNTWGWKTVTVPHNWGWDQAEKGLDYYRGPGWYRRPLNIGAPQPGRRYFLRFEAAGSVADAWLNGRHLGQHRGAFGAFCFEITPDLSPSGTNLLAVRVSNSPETDIAPISGDFNVFGGLYRPVHLVETADVNFCLTDHGSPGVAWLQTRVRPERAVLDVIAQVSNAGQKTSDLKLVATVLDASGKKVGGGEQAVGELQRVTAPVQLRLELENPHLWNGRSDPYLHRAIVELQDKNGTVLDSVEQAIGLRFYEVDPDRGFFLNGKPYHLHGVNKHQDRVGKGWAVTEADQDEDMRLIQDLGCTVIRCAHYQHSDYFYSLCDKAGILVWAELPQVNELEPTPEFAATSKNQLLDLIRQNINHPSIFVWSLFNELWPDRPDPHRELQDLKVVANGEDPTRPTIAATSTEHLPQMDKIPDLLGWNIYPGWYSGWGPKENFGTYLDRGRTLSRHGGLCISEYGAGASIRQHEDNPQKPKETGLWHPEEYQAILHEAAWPALKSKPFVWGTFVWVMFDFISNGRHEGDEPGRNDKGLVTADRKTPKDAYYYYRANWSDEPTLYIASRRYTSRTNAVTDVKVYSNAGAVEVSLNGKSIGTQSGATNGVFLWKNVRLQPGDNRVEARAQRNGRELKDDCLWTLTAPAK
ncbi:MAG: glycoside hydrolase family 2 TIM barrel-domain containing protein [Verrucomicrobiota bacterium]